MTITPRQMLVSSSKYSIKCPYTMKAEYITFHNTYNDASANNEIKYMINNNSQVSYHFAIDDKEVVQGIPLNRNSWHCGDGNGNGNRKSIGIEVCYSKSGGERYKKAEKLAIKFIAQLLHERGWGIDRVKKHQDWNGKYCPHRVLAEGRWQSVLKDIQSELNKLKGKSTTNQSSSKGKFVETTVFYENNKIAGLLEKGVTYVQLRELAELLNVPIGYDNRTKKVNFNNKYVDAIIIKGRSYLPVRTVAEDLGKIVKWDGKSVHISDK